MQPLLGIIRFGGPIVRTLPVLLIVALSFLAGSGSAVFGVFDSETAQERAIQAIVLEAGWRVFPCRTVGRNAYRSALGDLFKRLD